MYNTVGLFRSHEEFSGSPIELMGIYNKDVSSVAPQTFDKR